MARLVVLSSLFLLSFCLIPNLSAQLTDTPRSFSTLNEITVKVADVTNAPVADARVDISTVGLRTQVASVYTSADGVATIPDIPNGNYEVVVMKGIATASERLEVFNSPGSVNMRLSGTDDVKPGGGATVSVAQYKVPEKARKAMAKAQDAFVEHDIDRVNKELQKALEIYPQYAEALTLRGILKLDSDDSDGAIDDISAAIKADPSYARAYVALGAGLNRAQRFDEAIATLDRGISIDPTSWQAHFEMGKAQVSKGDYLAGLRSMDKAQSMCNDRYPPLHLVKAHALLAMRRYEDAMAELQGFLEKNPPAEQSAAAREMMDKTRALINPR